jgi:hypothetical protein
VPTRLTRPLIILLLPGEYFNEAVILQEAIHEAYQVRTVFTRVAFKLLASVLLAGADCVAT